MLMQRADLTRNLIIGIGAATLGLILCDRIWSGWFQGPGYGVFMYFVARFGFCKIWHSVQSVEITPSEIIYQSAFQIARVRWDEIGSYIFDDDRFVAFEKSQHKILLDITLRGNDDNEWPVQECAQVVQFIEQQMQAIGAKRETVLSLDSQLRKKIKF